MEPTAARLRQPARCQSAAVAALGCPAAAVAAQVPSSMEGIAARPNPARMRRKLPRLQLRSRPAPSDNKVGCAAPPGSDVGCAAPSEAKAGCAALLVLPCCNRRARSRSVERRTRHVIYEPKAASHSSRTRPPCERGKIPLCFFSPLLGSHVYYFWLAPAP